MRSYSSQTNQRQPIVTVDEMLNNKYDNVHHQMYTHALSKYFSYTGIDETSYKTVEIPAAYYDTPSKVQLIEKSFPYKRKTIDLSPYWETYKFKESVSYIKLDDMTMSTSEVKYRDYVRGVAELQSRMTGVKYKVKLNEVPESMKDYPDEVSISDSFTYKVQNNIYGA